MYDTWAQWKISRGWQCGSYYIYHQRTGNKDDVTIKEKFGKYGVLDNAYTIMVVKPDESKWLQIRQSPTAKGVITALVRGDSDVRWYVVQPSSSAWCGVAFTMGLEVNVGLSWTQHGFRPGKVVLKCHETICTYWGIQACCLHAPRNAERVRESNPTGHGCAVQWILSTVGPCVMSVWW